MHNKIVKKLFSLVVSASLILAMVPNNVVFAEELKNFVTSANANHWGRSDLRAYLNNVTKTNNTLPIDSTTSGTRTANYPLKFSNAEYSLVQPFTYSTNVLDSSANATAVYETTDKQRIIPISYWSYGNSTSSWLRSSSCGSNKNALSTNRGNDVSSNQIDKNSDLATAFKADATALSGNDATNQKIYFGSDNSKPLEFWIAGRETAVNGGEISATGRHYDALSGKIGQNKAV